MSSKVVVRRMDGTMVKGLTDDFAPNKNFLHITPPGGQKSPAVVRLEEMKAVFFVKEFDGFPNRIGLDGFVDKQSGREVFVEFKDGEKMWGYTMNYQPEVQGFFLFPADRGGNNEKVYVYNSAVEYVLC